MRSPDSSDDNLQHLASALYAYLNNLESDRQVCIRHASTTEIEARASGELRVTKCYRCPGDSLRHVKSRIRELRKTGRAPAEKPTRKHPLFHAWLPWEGLSVLVSLFVVRRTLTVEVIAPYPSHALPILPLRRVAQLLAYHETLVPSQWIEAVQVCRHRKRWPLQRYLLRSMHGKSVLPHCALTHWPDMG